MVKCLSLGGKMVKAQSVAAVYLGSLNVHLSALCSASLARWLSCHRVSFRNKP